MKILNVMTSRSFKYFQSRKLRPLRFICKTVERGKPAKFKAIWEENISQQVDYKPSDASAYDGARLNRYFFDDQYPAIY